MSFKQVVLNKPYYIAEYETYCTLLKTIQAIMMCFLYVTENANFPVKNMYFFSVSLIKMCPDTNTVVMEITAYVKL